MDYDTLYKTIARGRYNTAMPAWSVTDGGPLNDAAINAVIALIQHGDWQQTQTRRGRSGIGPARADERHRADHDAGNTIAALPDGAALAPAACNSLPPTASPVMAPTAQGTPLAPALNDPVIRAERTADQLNKTISLGSPGTVMAGWNQRLSTDRDRPIS